MKGRQYICAKKKQFNNYNYCDETSGMLKESNRKQ